MRPFVAAVNHMTRKATVIHKAKATPSVCFAIAIWRAALVISMLDPEALSVPLLAYVRNPTVKRIYSTIGLEIMCSNIPPIDLCFGSVGYVSVAICQGLRM